MQLNFDSLREFLPANSIEFVGNNQIKINLNQLTGENLDLTSSCVEPLAKLMQLLANFTRAINTNRASQSKAAIDFVEASLVGEPSAPVFEFTLTTKVDANQLINNIIDPTVE